MIKIRSLLKLFLLGFFLFVFQFAFLNSLNNFLLNFNIVLFFLIYVFVVYDFNTCLIIGFFVGLLFDLFSFSFFGIYIFSIISTLYFVNFLWTNSFTNRSLYSFLTISGIFSVFYCIILYFTLYLFQDLVSFFSWFNLLFFINIFKQTFFILFLVFIFFYFFDFESRENQRAILPK